MGVTVRLFKPHRGQLNVIEGFADSEHKFGVVSTGRQFGKSLLGSNLLVYWLLNENDSKGAWISPVYNQAKKVHQEISKACKDVITKSNKADLTIQFANGSTIIFLSAERPDSIRGFSFNYMVIDEAAFIKKAGLQEAILPTLTAIGKKCLIISTPKGKGSWFYEFHTRGTVGEEGYISFKGISSDNPYVDASFVEEQRKSLPTDIFAQEYLAEFVDSGNDVFRNLQQACISNEWTTPTTQPHYFGIDTGVSDDYSVLSIMDGSGRVSKMVRINGRPIGEIAQSFITELKQYRNIGGFVESNGIGRSMYEYVSAAIRNTKPFHTNNENKTQAIRGLISDLEQGTLILPSQQLFPYLYAELSSFTYKLGENGKIKFTHPSGGHDDTVDALWLSNHARNTMALKASQKIFIGQR